MILLAGSAAAGVPERARWLSAAPVIRVAGRRHAMRMITGLNEPAGGRILVNGQRYRVAAAPMAELGILLEARAAGTGRSARNHRR